MTVDGEQPDENLFDMSPDTKESLQVNVQQKMGQSLTQSFLNSRQQKQHEIRQSIVEATIEKYRFIGDANDIAVRTYAQKSMATKNDAMDLRKMLNDKKEEEIVKRELNQAGEIVVQRINDKLRGTEFPVL